MTVIVPHSIREYQDRYDVLYHKYSLFNFTSWPLFLFPFGVAAAVGIVSLILVSTTNFLGDEGLMFIPLVAGLSGVLAIFVCMVCTAIVDIRMRSEAKSFGKAAVELGQRMPIGVAKNFVVSGDCTFVTFTYGIVTYAYDLQNNKFWIHKHKKLVQSESLVRVMQVAVEQVQKSFRTIDD